MANIELPKDAEGREIPLDTRVLYDEDGNAKEVQRYTYSVRQTIPRRKWDAVMLDTTCRYTSNLYIIPPAPPDSWEKLEEDLDKCIESDDSCLYYSTSGICSKCTRPDNDGSGCTTVVFSDIKKRIRKLRGDGE